MSATDTQKILEKKERARWQRILRTYGITKEQYEELDLGYCPICLRTWSDTVRLCVDHDHHTGDVRGVICLYCNHRIVGRHRDPDLLERVANYLRAPRKGWIVPEKYKRGKRKKRKKLETDKSSGKTTRRKKVQTQKGRGDKKQTARG